MAEKDDPILEKLQSIESKLIAQEHRLFSILCNLFKYKFKTPNKIFYHSAKLSLLSYFLGAEIVFKIGSIVGTAIAFFSLYIAFESNKILTEQNTKFDNQNQLIEADRRSSLVFLFNNIMDAIDRELKTPVRDSTLLVDVNGHKGKISNQLAGRIIALSRRLQPYRMYDYDTDSLSKKLISPERGQLLINLLESNIDTISLSAIYKRGIFRILT